MGDTITDLPEASDVPPVPLKTYQWEDIRRQKLEGHYPWTHLYKGPYQDTSLVDERNYEYEPVIPMDTSLTTLPPPPPPPVAKIISENITNSTFATITTHVVQDERDPVQDKHLLCIPANDCEDTEEDSEDDLSEEITAEELQTRLEERYFRYCPSSSKYDYEIPHSRSLSPSSVGNRSRAKSESSSSRFMQLQAEKIKQKFKNFKEQISKESQAESTARMKRNNEAPTNEHCKRPAKKNKFNFRKHNVKVADETKTSEFQSPHAPRWWSFSRLPSLSRSRSRSLKSSERSSSPDTKEEKSVFHNPRIFISDNKQLKIKIRRKPNSAPVTPTQRRSPFPQRWIDKFASSSSSSSSEKMGSTFRSEKKVEGKHEKQDTEQKSIFISLHEDGKTETNNAQSEKKPEENEVDGNKPEVILGKMEIDNENFIFISLHEERFPEKLKKLEEQRMHEDVMQEEQGIEKEIQRDEATRRFHTMIRKLQNDRKMQSRRTANAARDEKTEAVIITEVTDDCGEIVELLENNVQQPEDVERKSSGANDEITNANYKFENEVDDVMIGNIQISSNLETKPESKVEKIIYKVGKICSPKEPTQKLPRKKIKKVDSYKGPKELPSAFEDIDDAIPSDEQVSFTKTYIKTNLDVGKSLQVEQLMDQQHITRQFKNYERALERSRRKGSIGIENKYYSSQNSLARLESPIPPSRPSRTNTLARKKKRLQEEDKENYYDLDVNGSRDFNTFPVVSPNKPHRKFRQKRSNSNSTTKSEIINCLNKLEDETINKNIVNSKQLSVSVLPLTNTNQDELMTEHNLRETSSMIHVNLSSSPLPPKRKNKTFQTILSTRFLPLPTRTIRSSRGSVTPSEIDTDFGHQIDGDIEYADYMNSTVLSDSPPKRPDRKRATFNSTPDGDSTFPEINSLPSEKATTNNIPFYDSDSKETTNGYAPIEGSDSQRESKSSETSRRKSRRFSEFFSLPRIRAPANYVPAASQTLDYRRVPSPSRPPRRYRPRSREPVYIDDENPIVDFGEKEVLNFNWATELDEPVEFDGSQDLQSENALEKMKSRPLPPPPRPFRKPRDDNISSYGKSNKKKSNSLTNNLNETIEGKIKNTMRGNVFSNWEMTTRHESDDYADQAPRTHYSTHCTMRLREEDFSTVANDEATRTKNGCMNECSNPSTRSINKISKVPSSSTMFCPTPDNRLFPITAFHLNISELNTGRWNIHEIESSKSSIMQVSEVKPEPSHPTFYGLSCLECASDTEILNNTRGDQTPREEILAEKQSRISFMIPEIGSEDESASKAIPKVTRPCRRKQRVSKGESEMVPRTSSVANRATFSELIRQILQICYSSVGQAIRSLLEQIIPDDDKRNEMQAAVWVITIIVAGCLMLGLQSTEKVVHYHHWDFHFPPPN